MTTRVINNTFARTRNFTGNVPVTNAVFCWNDIHFKGDNLILSYKSHMINRILHSWSFHMKFMKFAEGSFYKFQMK